MAQEEFQRHLLHDLEHYIRTYGLEYDHDANLSVRHAAEAEDRLKEAAAYQERIYASVFGLEENSKQQQESKDREYTLKRLNGTVSIITAENEKIPNVPLAPLAKACDAVYVVVSSPHFEQKDALSLKDYRASAVRDFLDVVLEKKKVDDISSDHVVECCQIAHFWQATSVLSKIVDILHASIDTRNCLSICELADRLELHSLFERSLSHVLVSMDAKDHAFWEDLNPHLKNRILNVQSAIRSSIHSRGNRAKVFFSSIQEYLAILQERVNYQQERLQEAKERQAESVDRGESYKYAAEMIAKQEKRTRTLVAFLEEQKQMFEKDRDDRERNVFFFN